MKKITIALLALFSFGLSISAQSITKDMARLLTEYSKSSNANTLFFIGIMSDIPESQDWNAGKYMRMLDSFADNLDYTEKVLMRLYMLNDGDVDQTYIILREFFDVNQIKVTERIWQSKYLKSWQKNKDLQKELEAQKKRESEQKRLSEEKAKQDRIRREMEQARREEQARRAEIERQENLRKEAEFKRIKERRKKIDDFLANEDMTKIYEMSEVNRGEYDRYQNIMHQIVIAVTKKHNPENVDFSVTDNVSVDENSRTVHAVHIVSAIALPENLSNDIRAELNKVSLLASSMRIPGTDTTYSVKTSGSFIVKHKISTQKEDLLISKKASDVVLKKGNNDFFISHQSHIKHTLQKKGKYWLEVEEKTIDGKPDVTVEIDDFLKPVDNIMIGYSFSSAAPLGVMVALNGIYSKHWGTYMSLRTSVKGGTYGATESKPRDYTANGYHCFNINAGATFSITKYGFLYAGLGFGKCGRVYSGKDDSEGHSKNYKAVPVKGLDLEVGAIVRPIKWLGASVGYNFIPGKKYGEVNFGLLFFLNR